MTYTVLFLRIQEPLNLIENVRKTILMRAYARA